MVCLYIQFGEYPALERLGQAELRHLDGLQQEADTIDGMLADDRKGARRWRKKVEKANAGIARWNAANLTEVAKSLHELPQVPQLKPIGIDLSEAIAGFGSLTAPGRLQVPGSCCWSGRDRLGCIAEQARAS